MYPHQTGNLREEAIGCLCNELAESVRYGLALATELASDGVPILALLHPPAPPSS